MSERRAPGWGSFHSQPSPPHPADDPPGARKVSEAGSSLRKSRLGKEKDFVWPFNCRHCLEKPATKQIPKCGHILCLDCLVEQGGECPLC